MQATRPAGGRNPDGDRSVQIVRGTGAQDPDPPTRGATSRDLGHDVKTLVPALQDAEVQRERSLPAQLRRCRLCGMRQRLDDDRMGDDLRAHPRQVVHPVGHESGMCDDVVGLPQSAPQPRRRPGDSRVGVVVVHHDDQRGAHLADRPVHRALHDRDQVVVDDDHLGALGPDDLDGPLDDPCMGEDRPPSAFSSHDTNATPRAELEANAAQHSHATARDAELESPRRSGLGDSAPAQPVDQQHAHRSTTTPIGCGQVAGRTAT